MKFSKLLILTLACLVVSLYAGDKSTYVGAAKCKTCHKSAKSGNQWDKWLESQHSKAWASLASEKAMAVAKEKGIADPQKDMKCVKCHQTGAMNPDVEKGDKWAEDEGVGCESCHGAGSEYYKKKTMEGLADGSIKPETVGLVMPTAETCKQCHNEESPFFKEFNFEEMAKKIAHPTPKG